MIFGLRLTPFNIIAFCVLALTAWVLAIRYRRRASSNVPLFYWAFIVAHTAFFEGGYNPIWVSLGAICSVAVRFQFTATLLAKACRILELFAIVYIIWRTIGLILLW